MTRTFKNILLCFAATSLLVGCDDNGGQSGATKWTDWLMGKDESSTSMIAGVTSYSPDFERQTQSGNYLAGQFAQYRQDWKTANEYMDRVIAQDPRNIELQQRSMILAMQAGDFTRALTLSRKVLEQDDKNLLALLFVGVDEIANQEYEQANRTLHDIPSSGVADFFKPILMAWSEAPKGKVDLDTLISGGPLHAYHALLIADYMGKVTDPNKYFVNILAGGGSNLILPLLMIFGVPPDIANGSNRVGIFFQSIAGIRGFKQADKLPTADLRGILVPMMLGGLVGSLLASILPNSVLKPALLLTCWAWRRSRFLSRVYC